MPDQAEIIAELEKAIDDPFSPHGWEQKPVLDVRFRRVIRKIGTAKDILEVGFGTGKLAMYLMSQGHNVDLLDIDDSYVSAFEEVAWRRLGKKRDTSYKFIQHDIGKTKGLPRPIKDLLVKKYDTVVACEVIEHITEYRNAVSNMIACARRQVVLTTPYRNLFYSEDHKHVFEYEHFYFLAYQYSIERSFTKPADIRKGKIVLIIDIDVTDKRDSF